MDLTTFWLSIGITGELSYPFAKLYIKSQTESDIDNLKISQNEQDEILAEFERIKSEGIDENLFRNIKKLSYGKLIRELNNVEEVANIMINSHMDGVSPYAEAEILAEVTSGDVLDFIKTELLPEKLAISVVKNGENE